MPIEPTKRECYGPWQVELFPASRQEDATVLVVRAAVDFCTPGQVYGLVAKFTVSALKSCEVSAYLKDMEGSSLAAMHGLLDFGLFDRASQYTWRLTTNGLEWEPPLQLEDLDFEDDSEPRLRYHILRALRHTLSQVPREYQGKTLDPEGVCMILGIARSRFDEIVGLLREGEEIAVPAGGNLYDGHFYITQLGIQAFERMQHKPRPKWQTKQAPEDVQERVPALVELIRHWIPSKQHRYEEAYRVDLSGHLKSQGLSALQEQGASHADILAWGIPIAIKLNPDRAGYDILHSQIVRHLDEFGVAIALVVRPGNEDLLGYYKTLIEGYDGVTFIAKP